MNKCGMVVCENLIISDEINQSEKLYTLGWSAPELPNLSLHFYSTSSAVNLLRGYFDQIFTISLFILEILE